MTQEEKARAYDKALKRAKQMFSEKELNYLFSELQESEDERIRKAIHIYLDWLDGRNKNYQPKGDYSIRDMLAWLEKQGDTNKTIDSDELAQGVLRGAAINLITWIDYNAAEGNMCLSNMECKDIVDALVSGDWNKIYAYMKKKLERQGEQKKSYDVCDSSMMDNKKSPYGEKRDFGYFEEKPADKVELKFKVGDYIKHNKANIICKIISVNSGSYYVENIETSGRIELFNAEQNFHLWTIADAKPEDVLTCNSKYGQEIEIGIVKKYIGKYGGCDKCFDTYCFVDWDGIFRVDEYMGSQNIHPATKEQRDALEKAMADAGYTFDFEKKELKKIEDEEYNSEDYGIDSLFHAQIILEKTLGKVDGYQSDDGILSHKCAISAVKKLYEQKPVDWSEEDELRVKDIIYFLDTAKKHYASTVVLDACIDWIKSIKPRIGR